MYDNFSDREYDLVDAYLAGTLQAEERVELNAAARENAVLYEYIVLRKQLQYIGKKRSLVSAALLVQTELDLPMPSAHQKPHFWQNKILFYTAAAASFLIAISFLFFYNENGNIKTDFAENKNESAIIKDKSAIIKDNYAIIKDESAIIKDNYAIIKDESAIIKDNYAIIKDKSAIIKDNYAIIKDKSTIIKDESAKKRDILAKNKKRSGRNAKGNGSRDFSRGTQNQPTTSIIAKNKNDANQIKIKNARLSDIVATKVAVSDVVATKVAVSDVVVLNAATKVAAPITYFKKHFPKKANGEQYKFNTATDTLFVTPQGTVIALPRNVFATTEPRLTLTVKEAYTYGDMLLHQLTTVADNDSLMETGGMLYLKVTDKNDKEVLLKPNKTIKVQMPSTNLKPDMQSFYQNKTDKTVDFENAAAWSVASAQTMQLNKVDNNVEMWRSTRLNHLSNIYQITQNIRSNSWGIGFDYSCAECRLFGKKYNPLRTYWFSTDFFNVVRYALDRKNVKSECNKYWKNPKKMNAELDSLKKQYKTKNIGRIVDKQRRERRLLWKKEQITEFNAYKRLFMIKDSVELMKITKINTEQHCYLRNGKSIEKEEDWLNFLIKYYKVKDKEALNQKIIWETLYKDSIRIADMMRYYNVKSAEEAKKVHIEKQKFDLSKQQNISFRDGENVVSTEGTSPFIIQRLGRYNNTKLGFYNNSINLWGASLAMNIVLNTAVANISELGWVNMDRFMGLPNLIALKPANPEKAHLVAIFKNYKCILGVSDDLNPYAGNKGAPRVPPNEPITLIAYKVEGDQFFIGKIETTTSDAKTAPVMTAISSESLEKVLAGL